MSHRNTSYNIKNNHNSEVFLKNLSERISRFRVPAKISKERAWQNLLSEIEKNKTIKLPQNNLLKILAIAASFILIIATYWYFNNSTTKEYYSVKAETKTIVLPDNSKVHLNAESKIQYQQNIFNKKRQVYLSGEAFFEVTRGKELTVLTINGEIKVLGTKFNVMSRGNNLKVYCESGKVLVKKDKEVILTKGKECEALNNEQVSGIIEADTSKSASWLRGEFWFDNSSLINVFEEVERQFNVEITYQEKENRFYTGYFNKENLNEALINICQPMSLTFEIIDNKIYIRS